jgi:DNA-binding transcriptional ArsR family regulator
MDNHLDSFFGALSDPTRRAVIERLTQGPAPVTELHAPHDMALPSFLKHLRKLEDAGLVRSIKTGRTRMVHIETAPLSLAEAWLTQQRQIWERRLDRLAALAESLEEEDDT